MHVLNRFLDKGASTYNDPERAAFYRRHRRFLVITGLACILGALTLAYHLGPFVFLAMTGLSALGAIYSITIVPMRLRRLWRYSKIKDVPGSKTLSEALAWGVVITLVPLLESPPIATSVAASSFLYVFSIVSVRSALFDIFQIQGDLIVGVETLPLTLGEEKTLLLLKGVVAFGALVLLVSPALSPLTPFSYLLLGTLLSMLLSLLTYQKRWLYPGPRLEVLVEANFFLAGLLGLIWQLAS
jgi:4-hydroxy-3-methylbut-2-enyl diphosphate reductase